MVRGKHRKLPTVNRNVLQPGYIHLATAYSSVTAVNEWHALSDETTEHCQVLQTTMATVLSG